MTKTISSETPALTSEYYDIALELIEGISGNEEEKESAKDVVKLIHELASRNLTLWHSKEEPSVSEVYSQISVIEIINRITGLDLNPTQTREVTFVSSSTPVTHIYTIDGGTHTPIDITMNRVFFEINKTVNRYKDTGVLTDSIIVLLGSPLSAGGRISQKWSEKVIKNGIFDTLGQLNAELVSEIVRKVGGQKILLTGHSYGAVSSLYIGSHLPKDLKDVTRIIADGPAPTFGDRLRLLKSLQLGIALLFEFVKVRLEGIPNAFKYKTKVINEYLKRLDELGITVNDETTANLSHEILNQVTLKGPKYFMNLYPDSLPKRVYIRQGVFDMITFTPDYIKQYLEQMYKLKGLKYSDIEGLLKNYRGTSTRGSSQVYPYFGTHHINRFSKKYLHRIIRYCRNLNSIKSN